jgi:BMFP domain-containing protein YqiC
MKNNNILDDLAKLSTSAASVVFESGKNIQSWVRETVKHMLEEMDVITRDEFEAVKKMAEKARAENEELRKEIATLKGTKDSPKKNTENKKTVSKAKTSSPKNKATSKTKTSDKTKGKGDKI